MLFQAGVFDGVSGDADDPQRTTINFEHGDGALTVAELDYVTEEGTKLGVGGWYSTAFVPDVRATDAMGNPIVRHDNHGVYILGEFMAYREPVEKDDEGHRHRPRRYLYEGPEQGLSVWVRFGVADEDLNQYSHYIGAGGVYTGLFPGRDADQIGLGVAIARNGSSFKDAQRDAALPVKDQEINVELTYHIEVLPWLSLQPDIQYIFDPGAGANGDLDHALAVGLRFEIYAIGSSPVE